MPVNPASSHRKRDKGVTAANRRTRKERARAPEMTGALFSDEAVFRQCVVTREKRLRAWLLRFVPDPAGGWAVDLMGRLPGRGLYVIPNPAHVRSFLKRRGVTRDAQERIVARVGEALPRRLLDGVGLARRAGCLCRGLRAVSEVVPRLVVPPLVLLAGDAADNTRQKLAPLIQRHTLQDVWEVLDRERLGVASGSSGSVAVLAVTETGMGRRVRADALRWRDFCDP